MSLAEKAETDCGENAPESVEMLPFQHDFIVTTQHDFICEDRHQQADHSRNISDAKQ